MKTYNSPRIDVLGSVRDLTLYNNKIGPNADVKTDTSDPDPIVGSIVKV